MNTSSRVYSYTQRGMATLAILILVGFAVSVAVFGALRFLQGSQSQTTAYHSQTQAQMRAWSGVDMLFQYFSGLNNLSSPPTFEALTSALNSARTSGSNLLASATNLEAFVQTVQPNPENNEAQVTINVTGISELGSKAEARSTVQVVYAIRGINSGGGGQSCSQVCSNVAIDLVGDFRAEGDIKFSSPPNTPYEINVDGNVSLGGISTGGVNVIRSTKSIKFQGGSATNFTEMHASCDLQISNAGGFTVHNVKATRNVCLMNTVNSSMINANGSVFVSGGKHGDIYAHANKPAGVAQCAIGADTLCGDSPATSSTYDSFAASPGVRTSPEPTINNIYSRNAVHLHSSVNVIERVSAEGSLRITGCTPNWGSAMYGGDFTNNNSCSRTATKFNGPWVFPVTPVSAVQIQHEIFDANTLRGIANYLYYRDSSNRTRVYVRGVTGIPDHTDSSNPDDVQQGGYYYRTANILDPNNTGWSNRTVAGYICKNNNSPSRDDELVPHCLAQLGKANNITTFLPSFDNGKWTFNGINHAPGVVFVDGNLDVGNGTYTNTFIVTGNINVTTAGNGGVFSLNYAGFNGVTSNGITAIGVCSNTHYTVKPTDFCQGSTYKADALQGIGNYALLAGSCPAAGCTIGQNGKITDYIGGDIKVEKSVFGVIKAGNYFTTGGSARIYGAISSLAQGSAAQTHVFGASTEIHLLNPQVSDRYNPNNCTNQCTTLPSNSGTEISVLWSRYL